LLGILKKGFFGWHKGPGRASLDEFPHRFRSIWFFQFKEVLKLVIDGELGLARVKSEDVHFGCYCCIDNLSFHNAKLRAFNRRVSFRSFLNPIDKILNEFLFGRRGKNLRIAFLEGFEISDPTIKRVLCHE